MANTTFPPQMNSNDGKKQKTVEYYVKIQKDTDGVS